MEKLEQIYKTKHFTFYKKAGCKKPSYVDIRDINIPDLTIGTILCDDLPSIDSLVIHKAIRISYLNEIIRIMKKLTKERGAK